MRVNTFETRQKPNRAFKNNNLWESKENHYYKASHLSIIQHEFSS